MIDVLEIVSGLLTGYFASVLSGYLIDVFHLPVLFLGLVGVIFVLIFIYIFLKINFLRQFVTGALIGLFIQLIAFYLIYYFQIFGPIIY